jgi:16S rRNA (cytosine1402-N4)-methyltransferase
LFVDCTVGLGGHSAALLRAGASRLLALDRDPAALIAAAEALAEWRDRVELVHADYRTLGDVLNARGIDRIDGAVADLGVSSLQLEGEGRGFSFQRDEPLDMRMDPTAGPTAADLVNRTPEFELANAIFTFGEERASRRIARLIVEARQLAPLTTTAQLASLVRRAIRPRGYTRIDPATRTFQALRIWVNGELDGLDAFVDTAVGVLAPGGRLAVIAFHSLEDRIVKRFLLSASQPFGGDPRLARLPIKTAALPGAPLALEGRAIRATEREIAANPRARSATLRVAERTAHPLPAGFGAPPRR